MTRTIILVALASGVAAQCEDTPNFDNGGGYGCAKYAEEAWCADGEVKAGNEWTCGASFKYPEEHCCVCGKATGGTSCPTGRKSNSTAGAATSAAAPAAPVVQLPSPGAAAAPAVVPAAAAALCQDTPGFDNGKGYGCEKYPEKGWCKDGKVSEGQEWAVGADFKFPEQNCCVCGKAAPSPAVSPAAGAVSPAITTDPVHIPEVLVVGKPEAAHAANATTTEGGECRDTLRWTDLLGHDCKSYTAIAEDGRQPCNNRNRQMDHDFFLLFGNHREAGTALENCCECGKGTDQGQGDYKKTHPELHYDFVHPDMDQISHEAPEEWEIGTCSDVQLWKDKDGHGCDGYVGTQCKNGKSLWPEKMITDSAVKDGESALTACCACGGGAEMKSVEGCQNVAGWQDRTRLTCFAYADKCAGGMRVAAELDFLSSRRNGLSALEACCSCGGGAERAHEADAYCEDHPAWQDGESKTCDQYGDLCANGKPVLEDHTEYESLANSKGVNALDACCMCGGGTATKGGRTGIGMCLDSPDWVDSTNQHCVGYEAFCADGRVTVDGGADALKKRVNSRGVSAVEACCVCGGGEGQIYPEGHTKWVKPPPAPSPLSMIPNITEEEGPWKAGDFEPVTVPEVVEDGVPKTLPPTKNTTEGGRRRRAIPPANPVEVGYDCKNNHFVDAAGSRCDSYEKEGKAWCANGTVSVLPDEFEKLKAGDGTTALDNCCACGGGSRSKRNAIPQTQPRRRRGGVHVVDGKVARRNPDQPEFISDQECKAEAEAKGEVCLKAGSTQFGGPVKETCADMHWTDSMGRDCSAYKDICQDPDTTAAHDQAAVIDFADGAGISAADACCKCGGGQDQLTTDSGETVHVPTHGVGVLPPSPGNPQGVVIVDGEPATLYVNMSGSFVHIPAEPLTQKVAAPETHHASLNGLGGEIVVKALGSFFRAEGVEDILMAPPAPPEAVAAAATKLPPGAGVLPDGTVIMTGAPTTVVSDETGTYVVIGDEKVRVGEPGIMPVGPGGEVGGELVVTPEGTYFQPTGGGEPVKVGGPAPGHIVMSSKQKWQLEAQYKEFVAGARVVKAHFNIRGISWGDAQADPSLITSMVNTVETAIEKNFGCGEVAMKVKPVVATSFLQMNPKPRAALVQHAGGQQDFPQDNPPLVSAVSAGSSSDVEGELFITSCVTWEDLYDTSDHGNLKMTISGSLRAAMPPWLPYEIIVTDLRVSSTDPDGPGGLAKDVGQLIGYSRSQHIDWSAVTQHREAQKESAKHAVTLQCDDNIWADNDGRMCQEYAENLWCSWGEVLNHHKVRAHETKFGAGDMCCACGGGHFRNPGLPPPFDIHTKMPMPITIHYKVVDFPTPDYVPQTSVERKGDSPSNETQVAAFAPAAVTVTADGVAPLAGGTTPGVVTADGAAAPAEGSFSETRVNLRSAGGPFPH